MTRNILFLEPSLPACMGGVERVTSILAKTFIQKGFQCYFAYIKTDDPLIKQEYKLKILPEDTKEELLNKLSEFIIEKNIRILIDQNLHYPKYQWVYNQLKKRYSIKIIVCNHASPDWWINKNSWKCTLPLIYFKDYIQSIKRRFYNPFKQMDIAMYQIADKYILLSESFIPVFKRLYHIPDKEKKLHAISNPCSFPLISPEKLKQKENIMLVVGRMEEHQKRISNILLIWEKFYQLYPDWRLMIVGDGPHLNLYKKMAAKKNLKKVEFLGNQNEVTPYYQKAKIFLMTSIWEGFGMTLVESLSQGCIPIAFDNYAALHDIIDNEKNGLIIPSNQLDDFLEGCIKLARKNFYEFREMSIYGIDKANSNFSIERIQSEWMRLFESL